MGLARVFFDNRNFSGEQEDSFTFDGVEMSFEHEVNLSW
jgi:hypothetical protein